MAPANQPPLSFNRQPNLLGIWNSDGDFSPSETSDIFDSPISHSQNSLEQFEEIISLLEDLQERIRKIQEEIDDLKMKLALLVERIAQPS